MSGKLALIKLTIMILGAILVFSGISSSYADNGHMAPSPKQQMANGVSPEDVQCNVGLQLMIKYTGDAACVKPSSASKLATADWGVIQGDVVTELPSEDNEMELEENVTMTDDEVSDEEGEPESHKIELSESMEMTGG